MHKQHNCSKHNSSHFTQGLVIGAIAGVVISQLFISPNKKENRKKLKVAKDKTVDKTLELYELVQTEVLPTLEKLKPLIDEGIQTAIPIERDVEEKVKDAVTHIAEVSSDAMESIEKRMKKKNKNAAMRKFFRGSF